VRLLAAAETACISAAALLAALVLFGLFVASRGLDPFEVYATVARASFGSWFAAEQTLTQAAPLMLTALCTALPARAGLLVIGGEGALVVGGVATVLAGVVLSGAPATLGTLLTIAAGAVAGALWIGAAGALRHWRGVNETIATLLMNYLAIAVMNHLVSGPMRDFAQALKPSSWSIDERFRVGEIPGTGIHWGLAFGVLACLVAYVLMRRTTFGFGVDILGGNARAARLVGLPVGRMVLGTCALGGAAAGLAGAIEIVAVHGFASASLVVSFCTESHWSRSQLCTTTPSSVWRRSSADSNDIRTSDRCCRSRCSWPSESRRRTSTGGSSSSLGGGGIHWPSLKRQRGLLAMIPR